MAKLLGWILMLLGLALLAVKLVFKSIVEKIPYISTLKPLYITIISLALIFIGFFISKKRTQKSEEVPIYKGKEIIGYRRK